MRSLMGTAALLLALLGCGDGDDGYAEEPADEIVACTDLAGEPVEEGFEGCTVDDAVRPLSAVHECTDGRTLMLVADDLAWGFDDETWQTGSSDEAVSECYSVAEDPTEAPTEELSEDTGLHKDEPTDQPDEGEDSGPLPACSDVWIEGEILPADYAGCTDDGKEPLMVTISCKGDSELTFYSDPETDEELYYAIIGDEVMPSSDVRARNAAYASCFG